MKGSPEQISDYDLFHDPTAVVRLWALPPLSPKEQIKKAIVVKRGWESQKEQQIQEGDEALDTLVRSYGWYLFKLAWQRKDRGLDVLVLINKGTEGLMEGIRKFDPARGYHLSTYVTPWIKTRMDRAIREETPTIYEPVYLQEQRATYRRGLDILIQKKKRYPTISEAESELKIPREKLLFTLHPVSQPVSLDMPIHSDTSETSLDNFIADETAANPEQALIEKEESITIIRALRATIQKLTQRQARVFCLTYAIEENIGKDTKIPRSCRDVGKLLQREGIHIEHTQVNIDLQCALEILSETMEKAME